MRILEIIVRDTMFFSASQSLCQNSQKLDKSTNSTIKRLYIFLFFSSLKDANSRNDCQGYYVSGTVLGWVDEWMVWSVGDTGEGGFWWDGVGW